MPRPGRSARSTRSPASPPPTAPSAPAITSYGGCKVQEESGELLQVLGKLGAFPDGDHPDGGPPLQERFEDESADVFAALTYYIETNGLDVARIEARAREKLAQFRRWGLKDLDGHVAAPTPPGNCAAAHGDLPPANPRRGD